MKIERPRLGGCVFVRRPSYVRRGDRFFPGTLFQDRRAGIILSDFEEVETLKTV